MPLVTLVLPLPSVKLGVEGIERPPNEELGVGGGGFVSSGKDGWKRGGEDNFVGCVIESVERDAIIGTVDLEKADGDRIELNAEGNRTEAYGSDSGTGGGGKVAGFGAGVGSA